MALLFMDSFDHYVTADINEKWTQSNSASGTTVTINAAAGRRGSSGLRLNTGASTTAPVMNVQKVLTPGDATIIIGFSLLVPATTVGTAGLAIASVRDGVTAQATLRLNQNYTLSVTRGAANGTVLGTSSGALLSAGVVAYVEWKVTIHGSAGTVDLRVNGAPVAGLALTGQNTQATAVAQWQTVVLGSVENISSSGLNNSKTIDFDDLYVLDGAGPTPWNNFLGDCRVDVRNPTGAGATTGWTPSTGANWDAVNDAAPDDDATYTSAATAGLIDTFVMQDAPTGATIYGVQHCLSAKKTDAGGASIASVTRHGTTNYPGTAIPLSTAYTYLLQIAALNPGTSAQWTEAEFNAAEFGYTRIA